MRGSVIEREITLFGSSGLIRRYSLQFLGSIDDIEPASACLSRSDATPFHARLFVQAGQLSGAWRSSPSPPRCWRLGRLGCCGGPAGGRELNTWSAQSGIRSRNYLIFEGHLAS